MKKSYFEIYKDLRNEWRWRFKSKNGRIIASGEEGYKNKQGVINAIGLIRFSNRAEIKFI